MKSSQISPLFNLPSVCGPFSEGDHCFLMFYFCWLSSFFVQGSCHIRNPAWFLGPPWLLTQCTWVRILCTVMLWSLDLFMKCFIFILCLSYLVGLEEFWHWNVKIHTFTSLVKSDASKRPNPGNWIYIFFIWKQANTLTLQQSAVEEPRWHQFLTCFTPFIPIELPNKLFFLSYLEKVNATVFGN